MHVSASAAIFGEGGDPEALLISELRKFGPEGATLAQLGLARTAIYSAQRTLLDLLVRQGQVISLRGRYHLPNTSDPIFAALPGKILALTLPEDQVNEPRLWRRTDLARLLASMERPLLNAVLREMSKKRQVLRLVVGKEGEGFLFAEPLRRWLEPAAQPLPESTTAQTLATPELKAVYAHAVRVSGGFPDVKISALHQLLPGRSLAMLGESLLSLWRQGQVTLSLGDWSLASEETRAAAIELAGERYLLVRFEEPNEEPLTT